MTPSPIDPWLALCALHSLGFAVFHLGFWRIFGWPRTLAGTTRANRAIIQIANLRLVYLFVGIGALCLAFPHELRSLSLGRAVLAGMSVFWLGRLVEQIVFLRVNHPLVHTLTAAFALGAVVFAVPVL